MLILPVTDTSWRVGIEPFCILELPGLELLRQVRPAGQLVVPQLRGIVGNPGQNAMTGNFSNQNQPTPSSPGDEPPCSTVEGIDFHFSFENPYEIQNSIELRPIVLIE